MSVEFKNNGVRCKSLISPRIKKSLKS